MGVGPALLTESHALLLTTRAMKDLALGVCTGCAVVVGGLYVLGAMAGTASTHDQRRRAGGTGTPMPVVRSTTASGVVAGGGPDVYESSKSVDEYLLFHFADPSVLMPYSFGPLDATRFMQRCAELVAKHAGNKGAALDCGCAVGGATFELARTFKSVVGLDFSHAFVKAAERLRDGERLPVTVSEEGDLSSFIVASMPEGVDAGRIKFMQGDACNLPEAGKSGFGPFDAILASNLLCRLPKPSEFLSSLPRLLNPGGIVVMVSPYSWLVEYTARSEWMGGCIRDGDSINGSEAVMQAMGSLGFELVEESNTPFLIREHARKFQYGVSHATVWRFRG